MTREEDRRVGWSVKGRITAAWPTRIDLFSVFCNSFFSCKRKSVKLNIPTLDSNFLNIHSIAPSLSIEIGAVQQPHR